MSQSIVTIMMSNPEDDRSFLMKSMEIEFQGYSESLEEFIGLMLLRFRLYKSDTELVELLYICVEAQLEIFVVNKFQCFVLTKVASQNMIIIILEYIYIDIARRSKGYIDQQFSVELYFVVMGLLKSIIWISW